MDDDPIVAEVRRVRDEYAARFNYDIDAIYEDIKEQERLSGLTFVSFSRDRNRPVNVPEIDVEPTVIVEAPEASPERT